MEPQSNLIPYSLVSIFLCQARLHCHGLDNGTHTAQPSSFGTKQSAEQATDPEQHLLHTSLCNSTLNPTCTSNWRVRSHMRLAEQHVNLWVYIWSFSWPLRHHAGVAQGVRCLLDNHVRFTPRSTAGCSCDTARVTPRVWCWLHGRPGPASWATRCRQIRCAAAYRSGEGQSTWPALQGTECLQIGQHDVQLKMKL